MRPVLGYRWIRVRPLSTFFVVYATAVFASTALTSTILYNVSAGLPCSMSTRWRGRSLMSAMRGREMASKQPDGCVEEF